MYFTIFVHFLHVFSVASTLWDANMFWGQTIKAYIDDLNVKSTPSMTINTNNNARCCLHTSWDISASKNIAIFSRFLRNKTNWKYYEFLLQADYKYVGQFTKGCWQGIVYKNSFESWMFHCMLYDWCYWVIVLVNILLLWCFSFLLVVGLFFGWSCFGVFLIRFFKTFHRSEEQQLSHLPEPTSPPMFHSGRSLMLIKRILINRWTVISVKKELQQL